MYRVMMTLSLISLVGCAVDPCPQGNAVPGGIPIAGATAQTQSAGATTDAVPAVGVGWKRVSFCIPKPKLFAVPVSKPGPSVVGIPIVAGAPSMTMAAPSAVMGAPMQVAMQPAAPQANTQGSPSPPAAPQSTTDDCGEGCCSSASTASVQQECDALIQDIANLQRQISIQAGNVSLNASE